jgi:cell fate regulator YaaT (PSP1 superfamily)
MLTDTTQNQTTEEVENLEIEITETENDSDINIDSDYESDDEESSEASEDEKENSRFKDGEKITMIRVRFPGNARSFPFLVGKRKFAYGQKVVAMSDRGMTVGYINSFPYEVTFNKSMLPIRSIAKVATQEDIKAQVEFRDSEKRAEVICLHLIEKYKLDMVLTHVEFTQFGKKAVFYFNAPARVDFRDLVKDLVYELKMRIELRQISVRDRAAALGSIGACGLQTCCSSFLKNYGNVSIKMAKNQNLALIPSKLNGVCGQIKCCIRYEDDVYSDKRKNLPREGSFIRTNNGDKGKVNKLNILVEQFEMLTDAGIRRRYSVNQYNGKESDLGSEYKFPDTFDNIINETQAVIGLTPEEQMRADKFMEHNAIATTDKVLDENDAEFFKKNADFEEIEDGEEGTDVEKAEARSAQQQQPNRNQNQNRSNNQNRNQNQGQRRDNNQNRGGNNQQAQGQGNRDNRNNNQNRGQQNNRPQNNNNQNRQQNAQGGGQQNQSRNQNPNQNRNNNQNRNQNQGQRRDHNQNRGGGNNQGGQGGGNTTPPPANA